MNVTNLFHQAPATINTYLIEGVSYIDKIFGDGYAEKHPELLGDFIKACAMDFNSTIRVKAIEQAADKISSSIDLIKEP